MAVWLEPQWPAAWSTLDSDSSLGHHRQISSWKRVFICLVEERAGGLPYILPGTSWNSGETTKTLLDSPRAGSFLSSPPSSPASAGGRSLGRFLVVSLPPALLVSGRRVSVRNPSRDLGLGSLKTFRGSSISKWVRPFKYFWKCGSYFISLCSILRGRGWSALVTKLCTDSDLWARAEKSKVWSFW